MQSPLPCVTICTTLDAGRQHDGERVKQGAVACEHDSASDRVVHDPDSAVGRTVQRAREGVWVVGDGLRGLLPDVGLCGDPPQVHRFTDRARTVAQGGCRPSRKPSTECHRRR